MLPTTGTGTSTSGPLMFEIIDRLGHGQFSTVYKAKWIDPPPEERPDLTTSSSYYEQTDSINCGNGGRGGGGGGSAGGLASYTDDRGAKIIINSKFTQNNRTTTATTTFKRKEKLVALKRIELCDIQNSQARMDYLKEVNLLQQVKHPNIINFNISFIKRNELFIVLELADGGDLSKLIKYFQRKKRLIPEQTILKYFTQVSSAVEYIHSKRILHRDIKPANIFMTSEGCVKLGDFGLGRFFSQNTRDAHSIVGTFYYMSPERIRESGYGFSSDVWSLGCVLYELITLNSPFSIFNQQQCEQQQKQQQQQQQQQRMLFDYDNGTTATGGGGGKRQPLAMQQQQQPVAAQFNNNNNTNQYNLQWLMDRITRAEYPSLDGYKHISFTLRQLSTQCLNPNPDARPDMHYICAVVYESFRLVNNNKNSGTPASQKVHIENSNQQQQQQPTMTATGTTLVEQNHFNPTQNQATPPPPPLTPAPQSSQFLQQQHQVSHSQLASNQQHNYNHHHYQQQQQHHNQITHNNYQSQFGFYDGY